MAEHGCGPGLCSLHSCLLRPPGGGRDSLGSPGGERAYYSLWHQHLVSFPLPEPNLGEDDEDKDLEPGPSGTSKASAQISGQSDTDITAEFLQPLLTPDNVANLVRREGGCFPQGREEGFLVLLLPFHSILPTSSR